jgi:hypothetical protein
MWNPAPGTRLTLIPESLPVSQWAQDNAKPGIPLGGADQTATLFAPKWAGRGEDGGFFIPGESFLMDGLAAAGLQCTQSDLLFEGGNAMMVEEPGGRRVLLLGEAEVHRNVARGMTRQDAESALVRAFQADACCVLPAASFHIDLEMTIRTHEGQVLAFVPDSLGAIRATCRLATDRLFQRGLMSAPDAAACAHAADMGQLPVLLDTLGSVIGPRAVGPGHFPFDFAMLFKDGPTDSGVGNLQRVLFALDWICAETTPANRYPPDRHAASYLRSLRRNETDRRAIHRQLKQLGWEVIPVPALSSENLSLNPINSLHEPGRLFMSAYGGFFRPLDDQAAGIFQSRLGPDVEIVRIATGETQRRGGGLHCAVQAW